MIVLLVNKGNKDQPISQSIACISMPYHGNRMVGRFAIGMCVPFYYSNQKY